MRAWRIRKIVSAAVAGVFLVVVAPATAAFAVGNPNIPLTAARTWLQIKDGSSQTGSLDMDVDWTTSPMQVSLCLSDDLGNGKSPYVKLSAYDATSGTYSAGVQVRNTGGTGSSLCETITLTMNHPERSGGVVNWLRAEKGNCDGGTCVKNDTDYVTGQGFYGCDGDGTCGAWDVNHLLDPRVWATTGLRTGPNNNPDYATCANSPSTTHCTTVMFNISPSYSMVLRCQQHGSNVSGNPYWLRITIYLDANGGPGVTGWIPSYYLDYSQNWVDHMPYCDSETLL